MKILLMLFTLVLSWSCSTTVVRQNPIGKEFPTVQGNALDGKPWVFPKDTNGQKVLLLVGFKQNSQFDIDRWLIGIDQVGYRVNVFEIPTINAWIPKLLSERIDEGMRSGIPQELWKVVVTVYDDADKIVNFLGNEDGRNARVVVLDEQGKVQFLHDRGFSVAALNQLATYFPQPKKSCN